MRTLIIAAITAAFAQTAYAGSYSPAGGHGMTGPKGSVVTRGGCPAVLVGGCGYCIGGKYYSL